MATRTSHQPITAEEFLQIRFPEGARAELVNGEIRWLRGPGDARAMVGGSLEHSRVKTNILSWLRAHLRGGPCRAWDADAAVQTNPWTIRYPDATIDCGGDSGLDRSLKAHRLTDPRVVFEVLSPGTRDDDERDKLDEYRAVSTIRMVVLVDPATQRLFIAERGPVPVGWQGAWRDEPTDLDLRPAGIPVTLPHAEIFARD